VPYNDPTLLFTNAGMNQFKDVFLGTGTRDYNRAVDTQKCIRAGGKHNDLEEVGHDNYHHTFFEMLGNWSFGDYYKKEAIKWAWELLTEVWKLPKEKLWATVHHTDDEALELWKSETDIDPSHILKFGDEDNFWEMGETGPCGPNSEIHIDLSEAGCKPEDVNAGREDVIEIWNLVFIQYNRDATGNLNPLPQKHVDTGMGFERVVRVLQNKKSNYETDLFQPLINQISEITGKEYAGENISSINAIADHIRALTFAISDGAIPSNEGRGYVLRRILRRAARLARKIGYTKPFLYNLVDMLVESAGMSDVFPEINERKEYVKDIIKAEEDSFNITLDRGINLFNEIADSIEDTTNMVFPGAAAFKLYDTFGFPLDLTQIMAGEKGLSVDTEEFNSEMEKQKQRARDARKEEIVHVEGVDEKLSGIITGEEINYDPYNVSDEPIITEIIYNNAEDKNAKANVIVLKDNPFYAESGGQISDTGKIITDTETELKVIDSRKDFVIVNFLCTELKEDEKVKLTVDMERRRAIERNHSATHLMNEALRKVLGSHIKQMGSYVGNEYLRFDFPHFKKVEDDQITDIEVLVNEKIKESVHVETLIDLPIEEAAKIPNAKMIFGEKYGNKVRVVIIDENFSVEFCGGTHVKDTSDIGLFKIVKEESISSGTRRIFARTGKGIIDLLDEKISDIDSLLSDLPEKYSNDFMSGFEMFKKEISEADFRDVEMMKRLIAYQGETRKSLLDAREKYLDEKKKAGKELLKQNLEKAFAQLDNLIFNADKTAGFDIVSSKMELQSMDELKEVGEELRKRLRNGVGLIAAVMNGKINLVCSVSDNLIKEKNLNAGKLIAIVAKELGGGGGGKPHIATAGAKDISKLDEVLEKFPEIVKDVATNYTNSDKSEQV
jgi:alanyl-tRNA synthetase